jgi:hypothetical protein
MGVISTALTPIRWVTQPTRRILNWLVDKPSEFLTLAPVWEKAFPGEAPFFVGRHAGIFALGKAARLVERASAIGGFLYFGGIGMIVAGQIFNPIALYLMCKIAGVLGGLAVQTGLKILGWALGGIERLTLPN